MADDEAGRRLSEAAWNHINADRFEQAEVAFRRVLDEIDHDDHGRRWFELVGLSGALNMLDRGDEGTEAYRQALAEAQQLPPGSTEVNTARYMLGNQHLNFGRPREALDTVNPVPAGSGDILCLLHAVAAEALWKLGRPDDARASAKSAMAACPTDDKRTWLTARLGDILES